MQERRAPQQARWPHRGNRRRSRNEPAEDYFEMPITNYQRLNARPFEKCRRLGPRIGLCCSERAAEDVNLATSCDTRCSRTGGCPSPMHQVSALCGRTALHNLRKQTASWPAREKLAVDRSGFAPLLREGTAGEPQRRARRQEQQELRASGAFEFAYRVFNIMPPGHFRPAIAPRQSSHVPSPNHDAPLTLPLIVRRTRRGARQRAPTLPHSSATARSGSAAC